MLAYKKKRTDMFEVSCSMNSLKRTNGSKEFEIF